MILPKTAIIIKTICVWIHRENQTQSLKLISSFENFQESAYNTIVYSGHSQLLQRNRLRDKFWFTALLMANIFLKTFVFLMSYQLLILLKIFFTHANIYFPASVIGTFGHIIFNPHCSVLQCNPSNIWLFARKLPSFFLHKFKYTFQHCFLLQDIWKPQSNHLAERQ